MSEGDAKGSVYSDSATDALLEVMNNFEEKQARVKKCVDKIKKKIDNSASKDDIIEILKCVCTQNSSIFEIFKISVEILIITGDELEEGDMKDNLFKKELLKSLNDNRLSLDFVTSFENMLKKNRTWVSAIPKVEPEGRSGSVHSMLTMQNEEDGDADSTDSTDSTATELGF